ncbi:MAG: sulfatase family protein [Thalassotalea sp.]
MKNVFINKHLFTRIMLVTSISLLTACASMNADKTPHSQEKSSVVSKQPNIIIIFTDDMGYGDIGVYGSANIKTPSLDRMANEGQKWTNFYAASSVCTPSRAGLLTGRLPIRSGLSADNKHYAVFFDDSLGGLPTSEITIAEMLKEKGYTTAAIGKWHLGHQPQFLPTNQGFDSYFGIPYSNDMNLVGPRSNEHLKNPKLEYFQVPLMRNNEIIEQPAQQQTITKRYTEEALEFIEKNTNKPFFLYLAHNLPHVPLYRSEEFVGKSQGGIYGDVIEEIDYGVGQILQKLRDKGLDRNTLVVFTSDNGPWLKYQEQGGSAGPLRDGKGTTWEGGIREPGIFWWPDTIKPAVVQGIGSTLDLITTISTLTDAKLPNDRLYDGVDLSEVLIKNANSPRNSLLYYRRDQLYAIRIGAFKAHFVTESAYTKTNTLEVHDTPLLYNLHVDPGEKYNIASDHPEIIAQMIALGKAHKASVKPVKVQLPKRVAGEHK